MKPNDIMFLLMGAVVAAFGAKVVSRQKYDSFRFGSIDFGEHHQLIGGVIIVLGVVVIFSVVRKLK